MQIWIGTAICALAIAGPALGQQKVMFQAEDRTAGTRRVMKRVSSSELTVSLSLGDTVLMEPTTTQMEITVERIEDYLVYNDEQRKLKVEYVKAKDTSPSVAEEESVPLS